MNGTFSIAQRHIGNDEPTLIIAELSANHQQDFNAALSLVHAAREAGADAVKLQTYTPDTLTIRCDTTPFQIDGGTPWDGSSLHDLYSRAFTPWEWHADLKKLTEDLGMIFFSTPFDETAVDFLESLQTPAYKIASFEIVDIPLLKRVAATSKPTIVSTGMASLPEIELAITTLRDHGCQDVAVLKCTSAYPAPAEAMNLRTIADLRDRFQCPSGLSDHTLGTTAAVASVCLGGSIIEKHLTLSRQTPGPDSAFSLEPDEFGEMVRQVRLAEQALGRVGYGPSEHEQSSLRFRRSLFVVRDIQSGELFTKQNVRSIRPADGLEPKQFDRILGRRATGNIARGTPLSWKHVA